MPSMRPFLTISLLFCCAALTGTAQRVYWSLESSTMGVGKVNPLTLTFEECAPSGDIKLPSVPGIDFGSPSVSNQTTIINFRTSRRITYTYPVQPSQRGSVTIPTFTVETDKGAQVVTGVGFNVGDASVGQTGLSIKDIVDSQVRVSKTTIWAGEVVDAEYLLIASGRYQASISSDPQWKDPHLVAEAFGEPERVEVTVSGERRAAVRYHTRIVISTPGTYTLEPIRQDVTVQTGERSTFFFAQPRLEEFSIASNQPEVIVQALPQPAPAGFIGAVGDFKLDSKIVPDSVHVGEPITWTLSLSGKGNWIANLHLPEREVSADFQVVQPKSHEEIDAGKMFSGSLAEDAVLVPTKAGTFQLGPVAFSYFDPAAGKYVEHPLAATTMNVLAPANANTLAPPPSTTPALPGEANATAAAPAPPGLPAELSEVPAIPSDPMSETGVGFLPFTITPAWWLLAAFVPPMLTWLGLAWRELRRGNSILVKRAARKKLIALLSRMGGGEKDLSPEDLEKWRSLCLAMWGIQRAAPNAAEIRQTIEQVNGSTTPSVWEELWQECEYSLFRPGQPLGGDWIARALHAAREARIRSSSLPFPHRWRHWAPTATLLAVAMLALPKVSHADTDESPEQAYRDGRYEEARTAWSARLVRNPRDWVVQNNVALAYAQEDHWPEAAAHWVAAFLLNPREPKLRANLTLALSRMDGIDPELRRLIAGSRIDNLVTNFRRVNGRSAFFSVQPFPRQV